MKINEKYFSLEFKENVNDMLFQKREFFVTQTALDKRVSFLKQNPDRYCDFQKGIFHVDEFVSEVVGV